MKKNQTQKSMNHKVLHMGRKQKLTTKTRPSVKTNIQGNGNVQNKYISRQFGGKKIEFKETQTCPSQHSQPCETQQPR